LSIDNYIIIWYNNYIKRKQEDNTMAWVKAGECELFETKSTTIKNLQDLCDYLGAENPSDLPKRVYEKAECGPWISLTTKRGRVICEDELVRSGSKLTMRNIKGFSIGTIVEGQDGDGPVAGEWEFPVESYEVESSIRAMEEEASRIWTCVNEHPDDCGCLYPF
jgi:hypothetical protein